MRHGRKTNARRFTGYKLHVATDAQAPVITAIRISPGNEHDGHHAAALVEQQPASRRPQRILGDTAYGHSRMTTVRAIQLGSAAHGFAHTLVRPCALGRTGAAAPAVEVRVALAVARGGVRAAGAAVAAVANATAARHRHPDGYGPVGR